ncbi:MAG: extracellular solute-binding protein [Marvinbryantia sp.]|jgi:putative aldouronate transport system substrate-binding protein
MKKKLVAALLTCTMTMSSLVGVAFAEEKTTTVAEGPSDEIAFQKFPEVVEVHIGQGISPTDSLPEGLSVDNNQYTDYLLENYNIKVVVDWTAANGNDYNQKVALCIASNTLPDAMLVNREYLIKSAKSGQLYDITELFQEMQSPQVKEVMDSTNGEAIKEASVDGRQYAIPAVEVEAVGVQMLTIRQDWLDECELEAPKTLADVENIAKVFMEKKPAGEDTIAIAGPDKNTSLYPSFQDTGSTTGGFEAAFSANDAYPGLFLKDDSNNVTYGTNTVETRETLQLLADWYAKGYIDPEMGTRDSTVELINSGKVGMFFGAWWVPGYGIGDAYRNEPDANWQSYPILSDDGKYNVRTGSSTSGYCVINKNASEDVAKAIIIMANALLRDESKFDVSEQPLVFWPVRTLMAPADECEYTYHELIKVLEGETTPEDYQGVTNAYKLLANDVSVVKETIPGYESGKQLSIEDFNMDNFGNFQRMYSLMIGDRPYATTPVDKKVRSCIFSQTETMEAKWSNLLSMEKEMAMKVVTGKSDISAYDEFVEKWMAEGGETILQEVTEFIS